MRALVQRVSEGAVHIEGTCVGRIGAGLVILLGVRHEDTLQDVKLVADKCVNLRIFADADGKLNLSALDVSGEILVVSQFTLYGDCRKGRRPNFMRAAPGPISEPLYEAFVEAIRSHGLKVETGRFGAMMDVDIRNDGPVTLMVEND
ncbi:MAG: D-tyrosyl-tRNA(Tyr) deacylase [Rhodothermales bacterium]|jgi:D-tyrosyl-tRNA(Tyr) deacylase